MASDVGQYLWETCCKQIGPKLLGPLSEDPQLMKNLVLDETSQKSIWSSPADYAVLLQYLYDFNDALADDRVFAEQLPQLSCLNPFRPIFSEKRELESKRKQLFRFIEQHRNLSSMHTSPIMTMFPTGRHICFELSASRFLDFGQTEKEIDAFLADKGCKAIGVYGISGSGKTAFLQKVLNSSPVCKEFSPILWVCLSDMDSEEHEAMDAMIVKYMLSLLGIDVDKWTIVNPSITLLLENLKTLLMSKKFLIVFDDMRQKNDFYSNLGADSDTVGNRLVDALPRDGGGKVIITSRLKGVAQKAVGEMNLFHMNFVQSKASQVIGCDEQEKEIEALLADKGYKAIGVYGMSGSGKTALVQKVLNKPSVYDVFSPITWVCLSDINSKDDEEIEVNIVKYILSELGSDVDRWMTLDHGNSNLLEILKNLLLSEKYLIVFDDVWEKNDFYVNLGDPSSVAGTVVNRLSAALPKDGGGKIIVTSRWREVAESMVGQKNLIHMKPLNCEGCRFILEAGTGFLQYATEIESLLDDSGFVAIGVYGPSNSVNTALIHKVLSNASVHGQFEPIVWVCESHISSREELSIRSKILIYMLKELKYDVDESTGALSEFELLEIVNHLLLSKRYLIVLADLGNKNDWEGDLAYRSHWIWLLDALRQNSDGTVIVISDMKEVAQGMVSENKLIHVRLPELGTDETSEVTIHRQYVTDEIVDKCHNLPLAAKTLANIIRDDKGPRVPRASSELNEKILVHSAMKSLQASYDNLDRLDLRLCFLFLSVFPEKEVIKKRPLIYWWIGEGLIKTEEDGEKIFEELLKLGVIEPHRNGKCPVVTKCKIHPWIRFMLISLARNALLFDFDSKGVPLFEISTSRRACLVRDATNLCFDNASRYENLRTIFNLDENYLDFKSEWVASLKRLVVLQLGRWQDSPTHHIEVQSEAFLKALRTQKHLKYISFRGISRITQLPPSIVELVSLEILDLKACHNLETLPADIGPMKKLTHLDISECYLLESMPVGLEKLSSLQVLKGFIIGNAKKTPCRIGDLKSLKNLKRLSIHIGSEAVIQNGEFEQLENLEKIRCLKISWGVASRKLREQVVKQSFSFPRHLKKLVLEGIPKDGVQEWLKPSKLKELEKLYIRGGKLNSLDHSDDGEWKVEILRLKYLNLDIGIIKLKEMFPALRYLEKIGRKKTKGVRAPETNAAEDEDIEWSKDDPDASMS